MKVVKVLIVSNLKTPCCAVFTLPEGRDVTLPDPKVADFVKKSLLSIEFIGVLGNAW